MNLMSDYNSHPKNLLLYLNPFLERIQMHPRNYISFKDKRLSVIEDSSRDPYKKGFDIIQCINPIDSSYVLGTNDTIINPFLEESSVLLKEILAFKLVAIDNTKNCQEINSWYKEMFELFNKRLFIQNVVEDIKYWSQKHNIDIDISSLMKKYDF